MYCLILKQCMSLHETVWRPPEGLWLGTPAKTPSVVFQIWARQRPWQRKWRRLLWLLTAVHTGHHRHEEVFHTQVSHFCQRAWEQSSPHAHEYRDFPWLRQRQSGFLWHGSHEMPLRAPGGLLAHHVPSICLNGQRGSPAGGTHHGKIPRIPRAHVV